jgi:dynein light chain LC8-type
MADVSAPAKLAPSGGSKVKDTRTKKQQDLDTVPDPVVKYIDITPANRDIAVNAAKLAFLAKTKGEVNHWKDCAEMIQKEFDSVPGNWHCIVGQHFGSFVSHEAGHMFYFFIGHMAVLLFRHG